MKVLDQGWGCQIHPDAKIDVDHLTIGDGTIIRAGAELYGRKITLGRECFIDEYAVIGGGSAADGTLEAGDWLHMGMFSQINTARDVRIGHEVGLGIGTRVFTHGGYLSEYDGFPCAFDGVTIGDRCWLPNAIVLPGARIFDDTVVAACSVVAGEVGGGITGSGLRIEARSLWAGTPARRVGSINRRTDEQRRAVLERIVDEAEVGYVVDGHTIAVAGARFQVGRRSIDGPVTESSERVRNQLRRHGIRFRFSPGTHVYERWTEDA